MSTNINNKSKFDLWIDSQIRSLEDDGFELNLEYSSNTDDTFSWSDELEESYYTSTLSPQQHKELKECDERISRGEISNQLQEIFDSSPHKTSEEDMKYFEKLFVEVGLIDTNKTIVQ